MMSNTTAGRPGIRKRRRLAFKLAVLGLSVILSLVAAEGAVRLLGIAPALPDQYGDFIHDPYLPYARKPHSVRRGTSRSQEYEYEYSHNSRGLRDIEHTIEKPEGVFRILALGDSFTYGVGADFEFTYLYLLEQLLNARGTGHNKVEIIKAGVPRYFPEIERLQLEHYGIQYAPDLVLVAFTSNDIADTIRGLDALRPTSKEGYLVNKRSERLGSVGTWLYIRSEAARIILTAYLSQTEQPKKKRKPLEDMTDQDEEAAWVKVEQEYDRMCAIAEQHGARMAVTNIRGGSARHLARMMENKSYQFIDLHPYMTAARRTRPWEPLYWPRDGHCTPAGYGVVASGLYRELTQRGLVP